MKEKEPNGMPEEFREWLMKQDEPLIISVDPESKNINCVSGSESHYIWEEFKAYLELEEDGIIVFNYDRYVEDHEPWEQEKWIPLLGRKSGKK